MKVVIASLLLAASSNVFADSLVLGRVLSSNSSGISACVEESEEDKDPNVLASICMHSWFRWNIDVHKTIGGKKLTGRIHAVRAQHTSMLRSYQNRLRLFALQPIEDSALRSKLHADYYLLDMSQEMYCMSQNPEEFGLAEASYVHGAGDEKEYCFDLRTKNEK